MLKTKTIKTDKATVLVVELPEGITEVTNTGKRLAIPDRKGGHHFFEGNWQLLGRLLDITEDQKEKFVGRYFNNYHVQQKLHQEPRNDMFWVRYPNGNNKFFNTKDECYSHAIDMEFKHLLQLNKIYFENILGRSPNARDEDAGSEKEFEQIRWNEAQSKVFDKERTYIFIKEDSFYCKERNNVGYICEEQCYSCRKTNDFKL